MQLSQFLENFLRLKFLAQAFGVAVSHRSGGRLATILAATIFVIIFFWHERSEFGRLTGNNVSGHYKDHNYYYSPPF